MREKTNIGLHIIRVVLFLGVLLALWFIFSNSLKDGTASTEQSVTVTHKVQEVVGSIVPDSPIATATGEDFDFLHACIRNIAHFLEYALLGMFAFGLYLACTGQKRYALFPLAFGSLVSVFDEYVQTLTDGRGAEWTDFLVDSAGVFAGCLFALLVFFVIVLIVRRARKKKEGV